MSTHRHHRHHRERGATLVEFALIALVFFTLIFGIFEFGMVFRSRTTTKDAASDGARIGAIQGPGIVGSGENADFSIIKAIREDTSAIDPDDIVRIVVFKGSASGWARRRARSPSLQAGDPRGGPLQRLQRPDRGLRACAGRRCGLLQLRRDGQQPRVPVEPHVSPQRAPIVGRTGDHGVTASS